MVSRTSVRAASTSDSNGSSSSPRMTVRSAGAPADSRPDIGQPEQAGGAGGDRAHQSFRAQLASLVRDVQLVEQVAFAAQPRIAAERQPIGIVEPPHIGRAIEQELIGRGAPDQAGAGAQHHVSREVAHRHAVDQDGVARQASHLLQRRDFAAGVFVESLGRMDHPRPIRRRRLMRVRDRRPIDVQRVAEAIALDDADREALSQRPVQRVVVADRGHPRQQVLEAADPHAVGERVRPGHRQPRIAN